MLPCLYAAVTRCVTGQYVLPTQGAVPLVKAVPRCSASLNHAVAVLMLLADKHRQCGRKPCWWLMGFWWCTVMYRPVRTACVPHVVYSRTWASEAESAQQRASVLRPYAQWRVPTGGVGVCTNEYVCAQVEDC